MSIAHFIRFFSLEIRSFVVRLMENETDRSMHVPFWVHTHAGDAHPIRPLLTLSSTFLFNAFRHSIQEYKRVYVKHTQAPSY